MPIYKQTTEITKIDNVWANIDKDIVEVYFGDKNIFTVWREYDGSLPITINANGDALLDYRIYGTDSGVGEPTENLFDKNAKDAENGYANGKVLRPDGTSPQVTGQEYYFTTEYIEIPNNATNLTLVENSPSAVSGICFYDTNKEYISGMSNMTPGVPAIISCPTGAVYFRTVIAKQYINKAMVVPGSTAPTSYIPYGYKLPMTIGDGNTTQTVPVYIGENQLGEDEYVSYSDGKIYKRTENLLNSKIIGVTQKIKIEPNTKYVLSRYTRLGVEKIFWSVYNESDNIIYGTMFMQNDLAMRVPSLNNASYIMITIPEIAYDAISIVKGTFINTKTAVPTTYIPYVEPTDPPVPLPDIPTINGETVIDYDGDPKPSQMYIKYRKQYS